jgi:hypothetical protein
MFVVWGLGLVSGPHTGLSRPGFDGNRDLTWV